jgi:Uma2 family endonuclease
MAVPQPVKRYSPAEYYRLEREAEYRSDYYDGEIFAMAGNTTRHSKIVINVGGELHARLKGKPCSPYDSNQRLKIKATGLRTYPDVSIYCEPIIYDDEDSWSETALNPTVVFEVLSPSTETYDRGFKAENYRRIPSLQAYVLIAQDTPHVEVYERQADNSWLLREQSDMGAAVTLPILSVTLPLKDIYDRIDFPSPGLPPRPRN